MGPKFTEIGGSRTEIPYRGLERLEGISQEELEGNGENPPTNKENGEDNQGLPSNARRLGQGSLLS